VTRTTISLITPTTGSSACAPQNANGNIETGFAHAVAVIMATSAYRAGKKVTGRRREEIVDQPPA